MLASHRCWLKPNSYTAFTLVGVRVQRLSDKGFYGLLQQLCQARSFGSFVNTLEATLGTSNLFMKRMAIATAESAESVLHPTRWFASWQTDAWPAIAVALAAGKPLCDYPDICSQFLSRIAKYRDRPAGQRRLPEPLVIDTAPAIPVAEASVSNNLPPKKSRRLTSAELRKRRALKALGFNAKQDGTWWQDVSVSIELDSVATACSCQVSLPVGDLRLSRDSVADIAASLNAARSALPYPLIRNQLQACIQQVIESAPADLNWGGRERLFMLVRDLLQANLPLPQLLLRIPESATALLREISREQESMRTRAALKLETYQDGFAEARKIERKFHVVLGPTNSGKTHLAIEALAQAYSGAYLAPLRLLALENYDKLNRAGVVCDLITGEERITMESARHTSATIEMASFRNPVDVAVIDEVQLLADKSRGWAWTAAILGVPAKEVYLTGSPDIWPMLQPLLNMLGEPYEVQILERKGRLIVEDRPAGNIIQPGDAIVAFSRKEVLAITAEQIQRGVATATIYGALSPEVRRRQAKRFASGEAQVLVATDAIGMGLNLPIKRIIFSSLSKFDGVSIRPLTVSEVRQVAGRAGRYGLHECGYVSAMKGEDVFELNRLMAEPLPALSGKVAIAPYYDHIVKLEEILGTSDLNTLLSYFAYEVALSSPIYETAAIESMRSLASWIDHRHPRLPLALRFQYACAPVSPDTPDELNFLLQGLRHHACDEPCRLSGLPAWVKHARGSEYLLEAEALAKQLSIYAWLAQKYPTHYPDVAKSSEQREMVSQYIHQALLCFRKDARRLQSATLSPKDLGLFASVR